jgi:hypothetical protein
VLKAFITLFFTALFSLPLMASNQLGGHDSPYLAMHGDDPVNWQSWTADVLVQAKKENKLVFVSIGYFSCHWCHRLAAECFSDSRRSSFSRPDLLARGTVYGSVAGLAK